MRADPTDAVERIEPAETPALELALHVSRYRFAASFVAGRSVLDAGCGIGYGSAELGSGQGAPARYLGVDRSAGAIRQARRQYATPARAFLVGDVRALPFPDEGFDVVLSFEVVEHLEHVDRYLAELRRVLRPGGTCVISTPNRRWSSSELSAPSNPYHVREYDATEFARLLVSHFPEVTLLGQHDGARARIVRHAEGAYARFLDRMGLRRLRHLLPKALRALAHSIVVTAVSQWRGVRPSTIDSRDYSFTTDNVEDALILLGICTSAR